MVMRVKFRFYLTVSCFIIVCVSCTPISKIPPVELTTVPPTVPSNIIDLLDVLENGSAEARISAAIKVPSLSQEEQELAIPSLIANLDYKDTSEVRRAAVIALGEIGPIANQSAEKIILLLEDEAITVRRASAEALGQLDDPSAVPYLAGYLNSSSEMLTIIAAESISFLTENDFTDAGSKRGYSLSPSGEPYIVLDAKEWWENEGKYHEWGE
jgi:hypothetical protein